VPLTTVDIAMDQQGLICKANQTDYDNALAECKSYFPETGTVNDCEITDVRLIP
jgi:hypothetical protein